jgi:integrase
MLISRVNLTEEGTPENPFPESMRLTPKRLKNNESMRSIPIHPIIRPLVAKLVETSWDGFLLSGLDEAGTSGKRSTHLSDDFGKWRRYVGVGTESTPFHALRHTFATALEDAEVYSVTASRLVGHSPAGMTFGTYSEGRWEKRAADMRRVSYGDVDNLAARLVAEHPGNPPKGTIQIRSFLPASVQRPLRA